MYLFGEAEDNLKQAELKDDGTYYYKISRVDNAYVDVELASEKSKVTIDGKNDKPSIVELKEEITKVPIVVTAEDGTSKGTYLIIEKESNDTSIKTITGAGVLKTEIGEDKAFVNVDEDLSSVTLEITLNNEFGWLKTEGDAEYEKHKITRTVDLSDKTLEEYLLNLEIKAEDGSLKEYVISVYKEPNLNLLSVSVNGEAAKLDKGEDIDTYSAEVPNASKPRIVITPENLNQTVQLLTPDGTLIKQAVGVLDIEQTLSSDKLEDNFIIKVISHNGEETGSKEYNLNIKQKSAETGITYIKVDGLGTIVKDDDYSSTVSGKDTYPVEIKLKDEKAKVRVEDQDGNIAIENQIGIAIGNVELKRRRNKGI